MDSNIKGSYIKFLPGWIYLAVITLAAHFSSTLVAVGGKHPLEATALAILFGMLLKHFGYVSDKASAGIKHGDKALLVGIVLLGASLDFNTLVASGTQMITIVIATMLVGFIAISLLGRLFGLSPNLSLLLAVGTTICGGTAIAVTAPLIKAKEEETSYAIGTITLWGVLAIFLYPFIAHQFSTTEYDFGLFAGAAIHSTPQVVGAAFIYSELSGKIATTIKLIRNCFIAPFSLLISFWYQRKTLKSNPGSVSMNQDLSKSFPWFLFGFFIMAGINSAGFFTEAHVSTLTSLAKWLILISMAAIGLSVDILAFKKIGVRPLIVGFLGALVVALVAALAIQMT